MINFLTKSGVFDNMNWRPPTFTDMQLNSEFNQNLSQNEQKFEMLSSNGMVPFDLHHENSNKINLSPEPLLSRGVSPEINKKNKDKIFMEKIFKGFGKKNSSSFIKSNAEGMKKTQNKFMDKIIEHAESNQDKLKFKNSTSKGFLFGSNAISKLTKRNPNKKFESMAIPININEKKRHAFNATFNVESNHLRNF